MLNLPVFSNCGIQIPKAVWLMANAVLLFAATLMTAHESKPQNGVLSARR